MNDAPQLPRPGVFRQWAGAHPHVVDILLSGLYIIPLLVLAIGSIYSIGDIVVPTDEQQLSIFTFWSIALGLVAVDVASLMLWRRTRPLLFFVITLLVQISFSLVSDGDGSNPFAVWIALYAIATRVSIRATWLGFALATVVATGLQFERQVPLPTLITNFIVLGLFNLSITLIFIHLANRARYIENLVERGNLLAAERDQRAQLAVAQERSRIAREMHDVVAHSLAVMVTLSDGAVAVAEKDPGSAQKAMEMVSETGRKAVGDMRRMLGVLRSDVPISPPNDENIEGDENWHPQPDSTDLWALVASFQSAGLPVTLTQEGELPDDTNLGLAVYRIVQESLTNVLRYAPNSSFVRVKVSLPEPGEISITVINGRDIVTNNNSPKKSWDGSGQGIIGMKERAAAFGGILTAEPTPDGGWQVHTVLLVDTERES